MRVVLLKPELNEETKDCDMTPKIREIDESGFLMMQFCKLLDCAIYQTKRVVVEGHPYDLFFDSKSPYNHKIPSYCLPDGGIIHGNIIFAHCNGDEVLGVDDNDAFFLTIHLMQNVQRLSTALKEARKFGKDIGLF